MLQMGINRSVGLANDARGVASLVHATLEDGRSKVALFSALAGKRDRRSPPQLTRTGRREWGVKDTVNQQGDWKTT
jgi:hypothetical protein